MPKYTITLQDLTNYYSREEIENWFKNYELSNYLTPTQIEQIEKYSVWSKDRLAQKIVDHYYMREIGLETPELFKHYAKVFMQEIMESKLLKIYTLFLEYDPLSSVDYVEEYTREITGNSNANGNSNSTSFSNSNSQSNSSGLNISNDTPQTRINKQDLDTGVYASNVTQSDTNSNITDNTNVTSNGSTNSIQNSNTIEKYTHSMKGDNGVIVTNEYLIREFRENIVAVDREIIDELNPLFMGLY